MEPRLIEQFERQHGALAGAGRRLQHHGVVVMQRALKRRQRVMDGQSLFVSDTLMIDRIYRMNRKRN
jgi:hypothetical protein